jgi:drug/metabolite transporter (DMT)-like permease
VAVLIGLLVAASFGTGDFLGGLASRRAATLAVLTAAQLVALVGAVAVALVTGDEPVARDVLLGATAGLLNVTALGCLYQGLSIGQIGQVAPVAAVIGSVVPVTWGLATGERPSALALAGVAAAVVAGGLISRERDEVSSPHRRRALALAISAGFGFGASFICFASTVDNPGFWPVLTARAAAVLGVAAAVLVVRPSLRLERVPRWQAITAGALDVAATVLLFVALRIGLASTVAPVAALAPGFTVGHAWWYLHERASRVQVAGLALALVGLVLIAIG